MLKNSLSEKKKKTYTTISSLGRSKQYYKM